MSRHAMAFFPWRLARLRETTGDPLLVRAVCGLVPTRQALELREPVRRLAQDAQAMLRPVEALDLSRLRRTYTLRTSEGFVETFGPALIVRVTRDAPGVRLRFMQAADRESILLRDGTVDLETGVVGAVTSPEVRAQALSHGRFMGVLRPGPSAVDGRDHARALAAALAVVRATDLIVSSPEHHTAGLRDGLSSFALPIDVSQMTVSLLWHSRQGGDAAHRWLRGCVRDACLPDAHSGADALK